MRKIAIVCFIILFFSVASLYYYRHEIFYHFRVVDKGKLYASGTLSKAGLQGVYHKTKFKTIIVLRPKEDLLENKDNWYQNELAFCKKNHCQVKPIFMEPDTAPTSKQIRYFLSLVNSQQAQPILVHCNQGIVRTGMMVGLYRVKVMGMSPTEAMEHTHWFHANKNNHPVVDQFIKSLR